MSAGMLPPLVPEVPEPLVPELPEVPLVPELPLVPEVPLVPELPLLPLVPFVTECLVSSELGSSEQPLAALPRHATHKTPAIAHAMDLTLPMLCSVPVRYLRSQPKSICFVACRETTAIESTSGISFGHTSTQFCALPQSATPPSTIRASRRSAACIFPLG